MPDPADYTNQEAVLERRRRRPDGVPMTDGYGKPSYEDPVTIRVRRVPARGVARGATGTDVAVETEYRTEAEVKLEDRLDGRAVRRVSEAILKDGSRFWFKAAV